MLYTIILLNAYDTFFLIIFMKVNNVAKLRQEVEMKELAQEGWHFTNFLVVYFINLGMRINMHVHA